MINTENNSDLVEAISDADGSLIQGGADADTLYGVRN